jgi:glutaredoxin
MASPITIYGSNWCGYTQRALRQLDMLGVEYRYVDVDQDPQAEQRLADWGGGQAIRPALDLDGTILVNPDPETLEGELRERQLVS